MHNPPSVRRDTDQRHGANPHIGRPFSRRGLGTILADDRLPAGRIQAHRLKRLAGPRFAPASIRLTSRPTSIWRGRRTSGISRTSSMVSRPSVRLASVTLTWSASWKRCLNGGAPMPRCRNCRSVPDSSARRCSPSINSRFRSAAEPPVHVLPIAEALRQVAPRNARAITVEHRLDEQPVILRGHSHITFTPRQQVPNTLPLIVAKGVASHRSAPNRRHRR